MQLNFLKNSYFIKRATGKLRVKHSFSKFNALVSQSFLVSKSSSNFISCLSSPSGGPLNIYPAAAARSISMLSLIMRLFRAKNTTVKSSRV
jgi:hypothetical protein